MLEGCYVRQPLKGEVLAKLYTVPDDNRIAPQQAEAYQPRSMMPVIEPFVPFVETLYTPPSESNADADGSTKEATSSTDRDKDRQAERQRERERKASL